MRTRDDIARDPWRMATDWFWLAHEPNTGRLRIPATHAGYGLAAAVLAELLATHTITLRSDCPRTTHTALPEDAVAAEITKLIDDEPDPLPIPDWLSYLSGSIRTDLGSELHRRGQVHMRRTWLRREVRWAPTDPNAPGYVEVRMREIALGSEVWAGPEALLAGLANACGLLGAVLDPGESERAQNGVARAVATLSPSLQTLITHTQTVVSAAVLSDRR